MPVFLERFVLPLLAAIVVIVAITNPIGLELRQRVIGTVGLLVLAGIAAYLVHRHNQARSATASGQIQASHSTPERTYVSTPERNYVNVKPGYLVRFFKLHTAVQANQMVAGYVGSWMRLSGHVENVMQYGNTLWQLSFRDDKPGENAVMYFSDERWRARLGTIMRGDKLTVDGKIRNVEAHYVYLEDCEFVD